MNCFASNNCGCAIRRKKHAVRCAIDADLEFLEEDSCERRARITARGDVMGRVTYGSLDT